MEKQIYDEKTELMYELRGEQSKCIPCLLNSTPQSKELMKN